MKTLVSEELTGLEGTDMPDILLDSHFFFYTII